MTLAELKNQIETGTVDSSLIVFKINKDDFIPKQYVEEMSRVLQMDIEYLSGIEALCVQAPSLFGEDFEVPTTLRVYCTDKFDVQSSALTEQKRLVIITKDVTDASMQMYKNHIIEVPNLVEWQIKDYAYSLAVGVNG